MKNALKLLSILTLLCLLLGIILYFANVEGARYGYNYHSGREVKYTLLDNILDPLSFIPGLVFDFGVICFVSLLVMACIYSVKYRNDPNVPSIIEEIADFRRRKINEKKTLIRNMDTQTLLSRLGTYAVLIPCYFVFALFFLVGFIGIAVALKGDELAPTFLAIEMLGFIGFLIPSVLITRTFLYMKNELAERNIIGEQKQAIKKSAKILVTALACTVVIATVVSLSIFGLNDTSVDNKSGYCNICDKKATKTFQGYDYCEKHYDDAVKWAIDNPRD